jgi:hypothetical protein
MRLSLFYLLVLSGCASNPPMPAARAIEWIKVDSASIHKFCREQSRAVLVYGQIQGCTVVSKTGCKIYAADFKQDESAKMAVLGHEVKHCFDGNWHEDLQVQK